MLRTIGVLSILILIELSQSHLVRRDVQEEANKSIDEVEKKIQTLKQIAIDIDSTIEKTVKNFEQFSGPVAEGFEMHLSNSIESFENQIKDLTKVDLAKETCGALSIREHVMTSYNVAKSCTTQVIDNALTSVRSVTSHFIQVADEYSNIRQTINLCNTNKSNDNEKSACIKQAKEVASSAITRCIEMSSAVKSTMQAVELSSNFEICLAKNFTDVVLDKLNNVVSCMADRIPGFATTANKIKISTKFFKENIIDAVDKYRGTVSTEFGNILPTFAALGNEIENKWNSFLNDTTEELRKIGKKIREIFKLTLHT